MKKRVVIIIGAIIFFLIVILVKVFTPKDVSVLIPTNYEGEIKIVQDKENYSQPYNKALENSNIYEYEVDEVDEVGVLKVKNINIFSDWDKVSFGFVHVEPIFKDGQCPSNWTGFYMVSQPVFKKNIIIVNISKCNDR